MAPKGKKNRGTIVIRREETIQAAHHSGAWKVAYADFVTAMMAFFLLMWLLNATTEAQRKGLADYFTPSSALSRASSGSGQPFGGHTPYDDGSEVSDRGSLAVQEGTAVPRPDPTVAAMPGRMPQEDAQDRAAPANQDDDPAGADPDAVQLQAQSRDAALKRTSAGGGPAPIKAMAGRQSGAGPLPDGRLPTRDTRTLREADLRAELARREREAFDQAARQITDAVHDDPSLADLAQQLRIEQTPEGMRIQLIDEDRQPMFATGSSVLSDHAQALLRKVGTVLARLPEAISISGHTDAAPFRSDGRSNWELSSDRANATRRLLIDAGMQDPRFRSVAGNADRDPLLPQDPLAAANRRIAILVLRGTGQQAAPAGAAAP